MKDEDFDLNSRLGNGSEYTKMVKKVWWRGADSRNPGFFLTEDWGMVPNIQKCLKKFGGEELTQKILASFCLKNIVIQILT